MRNNDFHVKAATTIGAALRDAVWRTIYRIGYQALRAWWFLRRPPHRGAMVALWCEGRLLLLRQSYRALLTFPGGGVDAGEPAECAACRELHEELGLRVTPAALSGRRDMVVQADFRRDHVSLFELHLEAPPRLVLDNREIVAAEFMAPDALLALPVSPVVRAYLATIGVP